VSLGWGIVALGLIASFRWLVPGSDVRQPPSIARVPVLVIVAAAALVSGALILRRRGVYFSLLTLALTALLFAIGYRWTELTGGESGLGGVLAVKLTAAVYLATLRVWLRDESPDLAPTMAALDRRLRGIERWYGIGRTRESAAAAAT